MAFGQALLHQMLGTPIHRLADLGAEPASAERSGSRAIPDGFEAKRLAPSLFVIQVSQPTRWRHKDGRPAGPPQ